MQHSNQLIIPKSAEFFGFSANETGGHMGRSMMLREIDLLVRNVPADGSLSTYKLAIVEENLLGKPTYSSREESYKRLIQLYGLDISRALFRIMRKVISIDLDSLALVALICVYCRDAQLRHSFDLIEQLHNGEMLTPSRMQQHLELGFPHRFSEAMKASMARNLTATWTFSGHLVGKQKKRRVQPSPKPAASTYAMFAGHLLGIRGETLIKSVYRRLVGAETNQLISHLEWASKIGVIRLRHGGGVLEIDFAPILTEQEQEKLNESA